MAAAMARAMPVLPLVASIRVSPGLMSPRAFGVADHAQCRPVLHRTGRVVALQLDQHGIGGVTRQALQAYQRCVAD